MSSISTHTMTAVVLGDLGDWDGVLDVTAARVTLDESWAPYCQCELTITTPSPHIVDLLDPRVSPRVLVTVRQEWIHPTRLPVERTFDLMLRVLDVNYESGTSTLQAESDEGYLIDGALVATAPDISRAVLASSLRAVINDVLLDFGTGLEPGTTDFDFTPTPEALTQEPGTTYWDYLQPLVQTSGLRLYCDEQRRWWLADGDGDASNDQISLAANLNLTKGRALISRYQDWFDSVVVKYTWTDATGTTHTDWDAAGTVESLGGLEYPLFGTSGVLEYSLVRTKGTKTLLFEWNRPYPGPGAARAILDRSNGRGRTLALDALSDYTATPGMTLLATLPDIPLQTGVVSSVEWRFAADGESDEMTVGSRGLTDTPLTAWVTAPDGLVWSNIPVGMDWTEYTP